MKTKKARETNPAIKRQKLPEESPDFNFFKSTEVLLPYNP